MVKLGKMTDYGLVLMSCIARSSGGGLHAQARNMKDPVLHSASNLAAESGLPVSTVRKLLKELQHSGLLASHRGTRGGYILAREPQEISVMDIIAAFEGPLALTECSSDTAGLCKLEHNCPISKNQQIINQSVRQALGNISLSDLIRPLQLVGVKDSRGNLLPAFGVIPGRVQ